MRERLLHTPEGVRDYYGSEFTEKLKLQTSLLNKLHEYGYKDIQTPTFEFFDLFSDNIGTTPSQELYKFFDKEGNTLVLRPDFTPSIARACAKYFMEDNSPLRFCYMGNTFSNVSDLQGRLKESTQIGAELINEGSVSSDAEVISLAIECMNAADLKDFQISIGNVEFFKGMCQEYGIDESSEMDLRDLISNKNVFGAQEILDNLNISAEIKDKILKITELFGSIDVVKSAYELVSNERSVKALDRLCEIYDLLNNKGYSNVVTFDLGMLSKYNYYTGVIFRAYAYGYGEAVIKGGRYDNLLNEFGKKAEAIGFAAVVDQLFSAVNHQNDNDSTEMRYLTIALGKGRLAKRTLELLEQIGITCEEMKDKDSRKLIFVNEELKLKFFLAKGPDVPTYVEYGAADIGVVGKDTILEVDRKTYEVLDLGFGKCRMCVCGPKEASELLKHHEMIRVATKYPKIAKDYFYNKKHQTVDIIKLNGSIELAPIVGLSDVIVDIVETGSTLRENGLEVLEEVCPLSARMIVNQVSMRMESRRINKLIKDIKEQL